MRFASIAAADEPACAQRCYRMVERVGQVRVQESKSAEEETVR